MNTDYQNLVNSKLGMYGPTDGQLAFWDRATTFDLTKLNSHPLMLNEYNKYVTSYESTNDYQNPINYYNMSSNAPSLSYGKSNNTLKKLINTLKKSDNTKPKKYRQKNIKKSKNTIVKPKNKKVTFGSCNCKSMFGRKNRFGSCTACRM